MWQGVLKQRDDQKAVGDADDAGEAGAAGVFAGAQEKSWGFGEREAKKRASIGRAGTGASTRLGVRNSLGLTTTKAATQYLAATASAPRWVRDCHKTEIGRSMTSRGGSALRLDSEAWLKTLRP